MPLRIERLRIWLAAATLLLLFVVAGFYGYARYRFRKVVREIPAKLGVNIERSTEGFTLSKSEGGRTLFTIHASKAVSYKQGGTSELQDVNIVVYGRESNRFDQIYGKDFVYDPQANKVFAKGEVHIDLEGDAEGPVRPDQAPPEELKNPIHLKTSGVVFDGKTGIATTEQRIEFRIPQGSGTAVGALYDSKAQFMTLHSKVELKTAGPNVTRIEAQRASFYEQPHQVRLQEAVIHQASRTVAADHITVDLRGDNSVQSVLASGNLHSTVTGRAPLELRASEAEFKLSSQDEVQNGVLNGNVSFSGSGEAPFKGSAGRVLLNFGNNNEVKLIQARESVQLDQLPSPRQEKQLVSFTGDALDLHLAAGNRMQHAESSGAAQIVVNSVQQPVKTSGQQNSASARTVITAGKFDLLFGGDNQMKSLHGAPDAKVVSSSDGQPTRTSTSQELLVTFRGANQIESLLQQGGVQMQDDQRGATAEQARYAPLADTLALSGNVRIQDKVNNAGITADMAYLDQRTGEFSAKGQVKTTYTDLKSQPGGAMLASSDPIHVTSSAMTSQKSTGVAQFTGEARLWQGGNIVQAPMLVFDRTHRNLIASAPASGTRQVSCVFVQTDPDGKQTPVEVTAGKLTYTDSDRRARFEGRVTTQGESGTFKADRIDVLLKPQSAQAGTRPNSASTQASEIDKMDARGHVSVEQPERKATGEHLIYTAADGKFVLTGRPENPPSIFDAERGNITGDSLTFFSRDDRVLVGSKNSRTLTQTRVK